jgi:tetratricopeptide (TPR) repeat protein
MKTTNYLWPNLLALALCLVSGCTDSSKARRILAAAERDFQAEKYDKAESEYLSVFRYSASNPDAIRQLGFIYFEEGRPQAFAFLFKANQQDAKNLKVQLKLAEIYGKGGRLTNAVPLLESVLQSQPGNEHALLLLSQWIPNTELVKLSQTLEAQVLEGGQGQAACLTALACIDMRMQKVSDAETNLQKAIALDPKLASPYLGMATIYAMHNQTKDLRQALQTAAQLSPVRSPTRLQYVEFELKSGDDEYARQLLLDITRQAPDYIPAWLALMRMSFEAHKYQDCQNAIDKILAEEGTQPNMEALFNLGLLALEQSDAPKALSAFQRTADAEKALGTKPMAQVRYYMAKAHLMNHEKPKAMADLNEALTLEPNFPEAVQLLAELYYANEKPREAISLLKQLVAKHPENPQAELTLADYYMAQQHPDEAMAVYTSMKKLFTRNAEVPRLMGIIYQNAGQVAKARAEFEESLALIPNYLPTMQNITDLDISQGEFIAAHSRVAKFMKEVPKSPEPLLLEGKICAAEKFTKEAETAFSKAIDLNPNQADGYLDLARLYLASHQEQQALDRLAPLVAKTNLNAMLLVGEIEQSEAKYEQARDTYENLLAIKPDFSLALNNLSYIYSEYLTNLDRALQLAQKAREVSPTNKNTADTLGWILYKKHQYTQARLLIEQSAGQQPNDPEVQMHLGMVYYMLEEEKPARVCLQRAVESKLEFPGKDLARRCIDILDIDPAKAAPETVKKLEDLVKEDPQDPVPLSRLASIQEQHGEIQKPAESLQKLISLNPDNWLAMMRLARINADHFKELRKAMDLAKSAHDLAPDDGGASALLGELIYRTGDYSWSHSLLKQAAVQSPDDPSISYHLALADYAIGRVAEADEAMEKAVQAGDALPNIEQAKQFLTLRAAAKDPARAESSSDLVKQVLDKDPTDVPALMVSALIAKHHGTTNEAVQVWQKVLSVYPLFAPAMRELAITYSHSLSSKEQNEAYEWAQKAFAAMPDDLELAKALGVMAYSHGDWDRSLLSLRKCAEKSTNDSETLYYLGMDFVKTKQLKEGTNTLARALSLGLADNLASQAQTVLKGKNKP